MKKKRKKKKKIIEVFVGATIVELNKETLEDLDSNTIKENKNERNC